MCDLTRASEEGWVVCRAFKKQSPIPRTQCFRNYDPTYFLKAHNPYELIQMETNSRLAGNLSHESSQGFGIRNESRENHNVFEIPHLIESPGFSSSSSFVTYDYSNETGNIITDWTNLDRLLPSQIAESASCSNLNMLMNGINDDESPGENCLACFNDT